MSELDLAIKALDQLENEIDNVIRYEFSEYGDRLDQVITLVRTVDRSDVAELTSQMGRMQALTEHGSRCTCEVEARWHACLGRLSTAIEQAAHRFNLDCIREFCEANGITYEEVMELIDRLKPDVPQKFDIPMDIEVPDDIRGLTA